MEGVKRVVGSEVTFTLEVFSCGGRKVGKNIIFAHAA